MDQRALGNFDFRGWKDKFPEKVERFAAGHWFLTNELEKFGEHIARSELSHPSMYMLFLFMVGVWKNPHSRELETTLANIAQNDSAQVGAIVSEGLSIWREKVVNATQPDPRSEAGMVEVLSQLSGFGRTTGGRAMTSAFLRFLDSNRYGTVDYRNWVVLSNTQCNPFPKALLPPLAPTIRETSQIPIGTQQYLDYLRVIRELAQNQSMRPADIDMALFAYSDEIIPLSRGGRRDVQGAVSHDKAMRIMKVVDEIAESVSKVHGQGSRARRFREIMSSHARVGNYMRMYEFAKNAMAKASPPAGATKTLETEFSRIEAIVKDC